MRLIIYIALFWFCISCSSGETGSVAGTETTNGPSQDVVACALSIQSVGSSITGVAQQGVVVSCVSSSYDPYNKDGVYLSDTVSSSGEFLFGSLAPGNYSVFSTIDDKSVIFQDVYVAPPGVNTIYEDTKPYGKTYQVSGKVNLNGVGYDQAVVYIAGTPLFAQTSGTGNFVIHGVPVDSSYSVIAIDISKWAEIGTEDTATIMEESLSNWGSLIFEF